MLRPCRSLATALLLACVGVAPNLRSANAAMIAQWTFDDGTANDVSGSPTPYDLAAVGGGPTLAGGAATFPGSDGSPAYLEIAGPGASADFTISLWVRPLGALDQGTFQGIFSNNQSAGAAWSWQIESSGGVYQWRTQAGTFTIGAASGVGIWDHILVRKFGGNDGDAWLNGVPVLGGIGGNPGGLQFFRLGVNRNSSRLFQMDLDDVRVFDSVESPLVLFATPEPATASLILVGLLCLAFARRRSSRARFA